MGIAALLRGKHQPIERFICAWAGCDDPAFLYLCPSSKKPRLATGLMFYREMDGGKNATDVVMQNAFVLKLPYALHLAYQQI